MMDKKEAMARLDAIEAEAKKLREIIEAPEKWVPKKRTLCWVWEGNDRPTDPYMTIIVSHATGDYMTYGGAYWDHAQPLTRAEALALVDEPSRYPWDKAPEWANWAATDADGDVYWFGSRPIVDEKWSHWNNDGGEVCERIRIGTGSIPDWRESLEPRP